MTACWQDNPPMLTHTQMEIHKCILCNIATDVLVLKHQAISIHIADLIFIVLISFIQTNYNYTEQYQKIKQISKSNTQLFKG